MMQRYKNALILPLSLSHYYLKVKKLRNKNKQTHEIEMCIFCCDTFGFHTSFFPL